MDSHGTHQSQEVFLQSGKERTSNLYQRLVQLRIMDSKHIFEEFIVSTYLEYLQSLSYSILIWI